MVYYEKIMFEKCIAFFNLTNFRPLHTLSNGVYCHTFCTVCNQLLLEPSVYCFNTLQECYMYSEDVHDVV